MKRLVAAVLVSFALVGCGPSAPAVVPQESRVSISGLDGFRVNADVNIDKMTVVDGGLRVDYTVTNLVDEPIDPAGILFFDDIHNFPIERSSHESRLVKGEKEKGYLIIPGTWEAGQYTLKYGYEESGRGHTPYEIRINVE